MDPSNEGVGLQLHDEHSLLNNVNAMISPQQGSPMLAANPSATLAPNLGAHSTANSANVKPSSVSSDSTPQVRKFTAIKIHLCPFVNY